METSRHTSPTILALAILAGGAFLLQHSGFFDGAFRTDILASVKAEDVLITTDIGAASRAGAARTIDSTKTAALH
ncbi:hypothetical protein [Rhizobium binxianense]